MQLSKKNDLIRIRQLEARSDNDRIIGKLQREIISTRTMYRLFARKYEAIHTELAHRERLMLKAESRRNRCDELLISLREEKQLQLEILNTTLRCAFCLPHSSTSRHTIAGADHDSEMSCNLLGLQDATNQQELELRASELAREKLEHRNAQLEIDLDTSKRLALCLTGSLASQGDTFRRIVSLNEEVKALKLQAIQGKYQITTLQEEKRRLNATVLSRETVLTKADRARVEAEARLISDVSGRGNPLSECKQCKMPLSNGWMVPSSTLDLEEMEIPLKELHISGGPIQQRECQPAGSVQNSDLPDQLHDEGDGVATQISSLALSQTETIAGNVHKPGLDLKLYDKGKNSEACDSRKYPALARANCSVEQQAHWTYSDGHMQKLQCFADTSPAAREPRNSRLEQVAAKTIKSLKTLVKFKVQALTNSDTRLEERHH